MSVLGRRQRDTAIGAGLPELGDDEVVVPNPVTETPPPDRFCDLVLTGGVASGVVYPWAIVELARAFRFKNIGGTSVGAMAAALAAAAEYGRRCGAPASFEVLRRLPGRLAEQVDPGRTRLQALFQPSASGQRLFDLFVDAVGVFAARERPRRSQKWRWALRALRAFAREALQAALAAATVVALIGALVVAMLAARGWLFGWSWLWALPPVALIAAVAGIVRALLDDLRFGLIDNDLGLVRGGPMTGRSEDDPGLVAWLHEGIQRSAGFVPGDPRHAPLTFRDLWRAPAYPGAAPGEAMADAGGEKSINLEMVTTNVTHGRPYRLPLQDESTRLYFKPEQLARFFPEDVMRALRAAEPYRPRSGSDPPAERGIGYFELPGADLPIVVAARLSLSFPLLFSAVPLYAVDYEMPSDRRELRLCRFSDGGICSNFPIHLFDSPAPRWPTFGMWLGTRGPYHDDPVWLPDNHLSGRGDSWTRFERTDPGAEHASPWRTLRGFLLGAAVSAKDWKDRSSMRMPQVRNRVARLNLRRGEGELNIAMSRREILHMADTYGTAAGQLLVAQFAAAPGAVPTAAWREHQWVRLHTLLFSLRDFLSGLGRASRHTAHTLPLGELIGRATRPDDGGERLAEEPLRPQPPAAVPAACAEVPSAHARERMPISHSLSTAQAAALRRMLQAAERLEEALCRADLPQPYKPEPKPELRVRPPL